jgi:hypothetical protein
MLFFDVRNTCYVSDVCKSFFYFMSYATDPFLAVQDCNYGDHCGKVSRELGVVSRRTPHGLQWKDFQEALANYKQQAEERNRDVEN